jgi:hypothetical protein
MPIRPNVVVYSFYALAKLVLLEFQMVLAPKTELPLVT